LYANIQLFAQKRYHMNNISKTIRHPLNIIFFGNSFTMGIGGQEAQDMNGIPGIVQVIATAAGFPTPQVQLTAMGGQNFAWHLENSLDSFVHPSQFEKTPDNLQWDYFVMQEYSTGPIDSKTENEKSGCPQEFIQNTNTLFDHARAHSPNVTAVLYETWARCLKKEGFYPIPFKDPTDFQNQLRKYYNEAATSLKQRFGQGTVSVAPAGDAWGKLGFTDDLYGEDLYHASNKGSLLNSLVIFRTIYGGITEGLDLAALCRKLNISHEECHNLAKTADSMTIER
jgi:hypothetical protein